MAHLALLCHHGNCSINIGRKCWISPFEFFYTNCPSLPTMQNTPERIISHLSLQQCSTHPFSLLGHCDCTVPSASVQTASPCFQGHATHRSYQSLAPCPLHSPPTTTSPVRSSSMGSLTSFSQIFLHFLPLFLGTCSSKLSNHYLHSIEFTQF